MGHTHYFAQGTLAKSEIMVLSATGGTKALSSSLSLPAMCLCGQGWDRRLYWAPMSVYRARAGDSGGAVRAPKQHTQCFPMMG